MTSNDLKMISKDLRMNSNEPVKSIRSKLGGDPSDNQNNGRVLLEQAFSSN